MQKLPWLLLLGCYCFGITWGGSERQLKQKLLFGGRKSGYVRPALKASDPTIVDVAIDITHIEKMDDKQQTLKLHGSIYKSWTDTRFSWNPADYNNTKTITLTESPHVWQPHLAVLNVVNGNSYGIRGSQLYVYYSGGIVSWQDFSITVACSFSVVRYPKDQQHCRIVFASMMYDSSQLIFTSQLRTQLDYTREKKHAAGWEILSSAISKAFASVDSTGFIRVEENQQKKTASTNPKTVIPLLIAEIEFARHKPYFYLVEVLPMLTAATLTLTSFWMDAPFLTLILLLATIIAQGIFSWDLVSEAPPATDGMPRIVIAYGFNFGMTSIAFLLQIIFQYFNRRDTSLLDFLPPTMADFAPKWRGSDLRPYSISKFNTSLVQFPPIDGPDASDAKNCLPLVKRIVFSAYVIIYFIFIIVIAL